ncbi:MAG TPA: crossover junction endodeoxyribonuclease RuvC [Candidatus Dormibacteraeota bacterium]|nr:crossover junction endodeoxyribonuclease RuvC [Candidatus Dormibacteraeota bacterium]
MRILGIDPGTATTGFGLIEKTDEGIKFVDAGVISTSKDTPMPDRLVTIYDEVTQLVNELRPDEVAVELLYFAANVTTAMTVGQARGVVILAAAKSGLPVFEYTPLQVKMAITGYGRADKKQMQEMVKTILKLKTIPKPDDAADGLAIAITHAHQMAESKL